MVQLKKYILSNNPYLDKGYIHAFLKDGVFCHEGSDLLQIFPNDNVGNYFYIRNIDAPQYVKIGDHPKVYQDKNKMVMVCMVDKANPAILISNLRNTLLNFGNIDVTSSNQDRELILVSELRGMGKEKIQHALQRLNTQTIVSINFVLYTTFIPNCNILNNCNNEYVY